MRKCATTVIALITAVSPALAEGGSGKWETRSSDGRCWAYTTPTSPATGNRGPAYLSIQNYKPEGVKGSISVVSGTADSGKGEVELTVDGASFEMLPFGDAAFPRSGAPESALIAAMRKGRELTVTWKLPSGEVAADVYSMDGFSAAKTSIDNCR